MRLGMLTIALSLFVWNAASAGSEAAMEQMVRDYYNGVMKGRAESWEIEVRRIPELREGLKVVGVRGDNPREVPRGTRICWLELKDGDRMRETPVTLKVKPVEIVPVAMQDIYPRTPITPDMVIWEKRSTESFGAAHIATLEDMDGSWAKVKIPAGSVIVGRRISLKPKVVIGQSVKLVIRIGRVEATAEGKAMEDGHIGERIRVLNLVTNGRLKGRVAENGTVLVE